MRGGFLQASAAPSSVCHVLLQNPWQRRSSGHLARGLHGQQYSQHSTLSARFISTAAHQRAYLDWYPPLCELGFVRVVSTSSRSWDRNRLQMNSPPSSPTPVDNSDTGFPRGRIAVCQMCSKDDSQRNFDVVQHMAYEAKDRGAQLVCFPECFHFLGKGPKESLAVAESLDGPCLQQYKSLAKDLNIWLSLGGFQERNTSPEDAGEKEKLFNCHVIINGEGEIAAAYRKLHLFDVEFLKLRESASTKPGQEVVSVDSPVGRLGLSVCYDLRFPELYWALRMQEAQIMLVPSAFTQKTGSAHWEVLLRARAIETQSYVVASAQVGRHNDKRESYGHAIVINPWGTVVAQCSEEVGMCIADINLDYLTHVRARMPVMDHRRPDVYRAAGL